MYKVIFVVLIFCGIPFSSNSQAIQLKTEQQIDSSQNVLLNFLLEAIQLEKEMDRINFLRSKGFAKGTFHSIEKLVDDTTHEVVEEGFSKNEYTSQEYEFIHFYEGKNYSTMEKTNNMVYKTRNSVFISAIRSELERLNIKCVRGRIFEYKNFTINFAVDRTANLNGVDYSIYALIVRPARK